MLRQKDLCPGAWACPQVRIEEPAADLDALPCALCPLLRLQEYLESPAGRMLSVVIDLDFALHAGVAIPLAEISYPELLVLRQLAEERDKYQTEEIKKSKRR